MSGHKPFSILRDELRRDPENKRIVEEMTRAILDAHRLGELRAKQGLAKQDFAHAVNVSQVDTSHIEHENDVYLSTLQAYIEALGGELEITARFPDGEVIKVG